MPPMIPREIVHELDKHIIGQHKAKRAVSIALRNRWRRQQIDEPLRSEITPKNILMIGPTGVGKTEIARRLAKLANAPFIKIEATKFTEVGYVGRDVESIVRDLIDSAIKEIRQVEKVKVQVHAEVAAEERVLEALLPSSRSHREEPESAPDTPPAAHGETAGDSDRDASSRRKASKEKLRKKLRKGQFDEKEIEIELKSPSFGVEIMAPPGMEEMTQQLQGIFQDMGNQRNQKKKLKVREALKLLSEEEAYNLINEDDLKAMAVEQVEQNGIVFLDEIDKVTRRSDGSSGGDVSREGVQRDLLPLVEGCTVSTKYGMIQTDHILFIASGAFHLSKPSDLIPELQGRLPIRVELAALSIDDFVCILSEPDASLTEQYQALLKTEGVGLGFTAEGLRRIAEVAWEVNERTENIGARRLHTVMERLLEEASYEASDRAGQTLVVDTEYVDEHLGDLIQNQDLARYIL